MSFLIVMVLLLVVMYVLMIRPQRQRQQAQQTMIDRAGVGDDILTNGGIYGTITEIEDDDVVVEIADGLTVHMTRRGIAAVLPPEADEEDDEGDIEEEDMVDAEAVEVAAPENEAAVTTGEEAVTSGADSDPAVSDRR
ncbi:MAG: preprotein translocase subunit YajC [Actinobacteria bacterium]|nr:preprotein translocase subunit YajC [Actinomycetota bacterium]